MIASQTKYRTTHDEGWAEAQPEERDDYVIIPCSRKGKIYKHGTEMLGYLSPPNRKTQLLGKLLYVGCVAHQQGDWEFSVLFPPALLDEVAKIVGAYRRPTISAAQRAAMSGRMREIRAKIERKPPLS